MVFIGLVVQLVRIHACHAWGRGFESRPDRHLEIYNSLILLFFYGSLFLIISCNYTGHGLKPSCQINYNYIKISNT